MLVFMHENLSCAQVVLLWFYDLRTAIIRSRGIRLGLRLG